MTAAIAPMGTSVGDVDPIETQEWLDALKAVLQKEGPERAHFLLEALTEKMRRSGVFLPFSPNTAWISPGMTRRFTASLATTDG